jgi:hypothetical protein
VRQRRVRIDPGVDFFVPTLLGIGRTSATTPPSRIRPERVCDPALQDTKSETPQILINQTGLRCALYPLQEIGRSLLRHVGMQVLYRSITQLRPAAPL